MATNNSHPRRQGREAVLQALYAYEIAEEDRNKVLQDILDRKSYDKNICNLITNLFDSTVDNKEWCEGQIKSRLNNWEFDRVALLDRLLLCVAISDICFVDDVPPKVSISEAIEIAKQSSNEEISSFVSDVFDKVYKTIAKETEKKPS